MAYNRPQYNNNYPKKNYSNNNSSGSNGGSAKLTTTKKDGCILVVTLNNQNLVLKGFYNSKANEWKLSPYYDKTKTNPQFNQPKQQSYQRDEMDDELPNEMKQWQNSPAPDTDFNPDQYEKELG